jgi:hypothetical protein
MAKELLRIGYFTVGTADVTDATLLIVVQTTEV